MSTVGELLNSGTARLRASGSESARLDAELLLGWALRAERTTLIAHPEAQVGSGAAETYESGLARREKGEPVAYIRGFKEFHGLAFEVDARALIPRPETEMIVDAAEKDVAWRLISAPRPEGTPNVRVLDVGTGTGAIAVALACRLQKRRMLPEVTIVAADVSPDALELAKENSVAHAVADSMVFAQADLVPADLSAAPPFDVILANLPYIPSEEVGRLPVAASFEPRLALDGGPDGLDVIRRLVAALPDALTETGSAYLEIGYDQGPAVQELVAALPRGARAWECDIRKDLSGHPRMAVIERFYGHNRPLTVKR